MVLAQPTAFHSKEIWAWRARLARTPPFFPDPRLMEPFSKVRVILPFEGTRIIIPAPPLLHSNQTPVTVLPRLRAFLVAKRLYQDGMQFGWTQD